MVNIWCHRKCYKLGDFFRNFISTNFLSKMKYPKLKEFRLYALRYEPQPIIKLLEKSKNVDEFKKLLANISKRDILRIKARTRNQSQDASWFEYRKCLITGTVIQRVVNAVKRETSSSSLNEAISKFGYRKFTCEAIEYGLKNEVNALNALWIEFSKNHVAPQQHKVGICLDPELPIIGGSPDLILSCVYCSSIPGERYYFIAEAKCPFKLRDSGIKNWRDLAYLTENCELKKNHSYYYQQNLYCGITGYKHCYFIIWTPQGHLTLKIEFDEELFSLMKVSARKYYFNHYIKDIL